MLETVVGEAVIFVDEHGKSHEALVTAIHDNGQRPNNPFPSVNLLHVVDGDEHRDQYGRQIVRRSSVVHETNQSAHGMCWKVLHCEGHLLGH